MDLFLFNQVELFPFSHVQEQVESGESNPVTPESGAPISLNNGKCFETPEESCFVIKVMDYKEARLWVRIFLNYFMPFSLCF